MGRGGPAVAEMGALSPAALGEQATAFNMAALSDEVIKTVVAVLTLVAAAVVVLGLGRALLGQRRPQVVIEDVVAGPPSGDGPSGDAGNRRQPAVTARLTGK